MDRGTLAAGRGHKAATRPGARQASHTSESFWGLTSDAANCRPTHRGHASTGRSGGVYSVGRGERRTSSGAQTARAGRRPSGPAGRAARHIGHLWSDPRPRGPERARPLGRRTPHGRAPRRTEIATHGRTEHSGKREPRIHSSAKRNRLILHTMIRQYSSTNLSKRPRIDAQLHIASGAKIALPHDECRRIPPIIASISPDAAIVRDAGT